MNCPRRQQFCSRHSAQCRMSATPLQVSRLRIQCLQFLETFISNLREFHQELVQRLALAVSHLTQTIKGIKGHALAFLQDAAQPWHPVSTIGKNQMANYVESTPCIVTLVSVRPKFGQAAQERVQGSGSARKNCGDICEIECSESSHSNGDAAPVAQDSESGVLIFSRCFSLRTLRSLRFMFFCRRLSGHAREKRLLCKREIR